MSKKDKIKTIEVDDVNLVPELLDGNHRVIPIVTGGDEPVEEVEVPEIIPILTLRSSVLFPGAITPITVGRDKSINLVRAVNAEGGILVAARKRRRGPRAGRHVQGRHGRADHQDPRNAQRQPHGDPERSGEGRDHGVHHHRALFQGPGDGPARFDSRCEEHRVRGSRGLDPRRGAEHHQRVAVDAQGGGFRHQEHRLEARYHQLHLLQHGADGRRPPVAAGGPRPAGPRPQAARNPDPRAAAGRAEEPDSGARQAGDRQAAARLLPPAADAYDPGRTGRRRRCRHREDARGGQEEELARGGGRNLREGVAEGRAAESRRGRIFGADDLPAAAAGTAVERRDEGQPRPQVRPRTARSRPFRSGRGEGAAAGAPGRHQAQGRPQIADPLPLRPSGRG